MSKRVRNPIERAIRRTIAEADLIASKSGKGSEAAVQRSVQEIRALRKGYTTKK